MSDYTNAIALSGFSIGAKIKMFVGLIMKTIILFSIFASFEFLKIFIISAGVSWEFSTLAIVITIFAYSICFLIFYIISEGILKKMLVGLVISIIGTVLAAFFPILGIVIAIIGIFSMIKKIISVAKMIPLVLLGFLLALLFFADILYIPISELDDVEIPTTAFKFLFTNFSFSIFGFNLVFPKVTLGYFILSALISVVLAFKYSLKNAMLRQVVIFMAIPLTALIIFLIKSALSRAFYRPGEIQQTGFHNGKIYIRPYMRADGTFVHGYFRNLPGLK